MFHFIYSEFAVLIRDLVGHTNSEIQHIDPVEDDPQKRRPDITKAKKELKWEPIVPLKIGLSQTIEYFSKEIQRSSHSERNIFHPHDLVPDDVSSSSSSSKE